jgi:hypothetical protein
MYCPSCGAEYTIELKYCNRCGANLSRISPDSIGAIVVIGILTLLTLDIFLVRQLSKIINAALSSKTQIRPKRTNVLANPSRAQLPQPATSRLQEVPSVTEGTTRFFEPYRAPAEVEDRATAKKLERKLDS